MTMFATSCTDDVLDKDGTNSDGQEQVDPQNPGEGENPDNPDIPDTPETPEMTYDVSVSGIEPSYDLTIYEELEIEPVVKIEAIEKPKADLTLTSEKEFSNNTPVVTYEWKVGESIVSDKASMKFKSKTEGEFDASFKVTVEGVEPVVVNFKITAHNYGKGLVLLSDIGEGTILTFKDIEKPETPADVNVFENSTSNKVMASIGCDIDWFGAYLTKFNEGIGENDLDIIVTTNSPAKIYILDPATFNVKYIIDPASQADKIVIPYAFQSQPFGNQIACFAGDNREQILSNSYQMVRSNISSATYELDNFGCSVFTGSESVKVYFDKKWKKLLYYPSMLDGDAPGDNQLGDMLYLSGCAGEYDANTYMPYRVLAVTSKDGKVRISDVVPIDIFNYEETIENDFKDIDQIPLDAAFHAHPIEPVLYYSKNNELWSVNYKTKTFSSQAILTLPANYVIKAITMNVYSPNIIYIAAENESATDTAKAALAAYDISNGAKRIFFTENAGGKVCALTYKGDGKENTAIAN